MIETNEDIISSYINAGKNYMFNNDFNNAIKIFNEGLNCKNNNIFNLYIAICYYKCGEYEYAYSYLMNYKENQKDNLETYYLFLSSTCIKLGEINNAYYYYQKYLGREASNINDRISSIMIKNYSSIIDNQLNKAYNLLLNK